MTSTPDRTPVETLMADIADRAEREGISMREQLRRIDCSYAQWMSFLRGETRVTALFMSRVLRRYPEYRQNVLDILESDPSFDKQTIVELVATG